MRTPLCDVLGIDVPVIGAPFGPWEEVDLAAAICAAGGLGSLGTAIRPLPELRDQWARLRARTDRPFAINHTARPFDEQTFAATLAERPAAISYHLGDPGELVARAHDAGIRWIQQVMDVDQARDAVRCGADVIIAQGSEAGGHSGYVSTLTLVPQVVDAADGIPVVAAGGIVDGRGLAAAMALGAQGVAMGTRFLATAEMAIDPAWKQLIVSAGSADSVAAPVLDGLLPPYNRPHYPARPRVLRTAFLAEWAGRESELAAQAPVLGPSIVEAALAGGGHEYIPFGGQSVGLVHSVLPAGDVVRETVAVASAILAGLGERELGRTGAAR
jgi:nitronate monooxygenase/enoyl-[acyl-carrier protein] reductase II